MTIRLEFIKSDKNIIYASVFIRGNNNIVIWYITSLESFNKKNTQIPNNKMKLNFPKTHIRQRLSIIYIVIYYEVHILCFSFCIFNIFYLLVYLFYLYIYQLPTTLG